MSKVYCKVSFLCIAMVLIVPCLYALTVLPLTDEQMAKKAEMIVVGRVLSAHYDTDKVDNHPYTYIHVRVSEYLKGKSVSRDLTLKTLGGIGPKIGMYVPGAANFYRDEEVLLFLERRNDGSLFPIGLFLGKYSIYRDPGTGRKLVVRSEDGLGKYSPEPRETVIRDLGPEQKIFFEEFRQRIRQFVQK
ncbi:hypothetical protein L0222_26285 [bacterium]|nr:hypothetical protein [bacterium]